MSFTFSDNVLRENAWPAVKLKLSFFISENVALIIPSTTSSLKVKSALLFPLCSVMVSLLIAFLKNLGTTLSGKSFNP